MRTISVGFLSICVCSLLFDGRAEAQSLTYPLGLGNPSQMGPGFENLQQDDNQTGIKLGPFRFKPGLQFNSTYTDNARFTNQNKESAFLFSVDPSFSFTLSKGMKLKDYLSFGYDGDLGAYLNLGSYNYTTHNLWADLNLMERPTTYMRLRETISYTDNPYGTQEFVGLGTAVSRLLNQADFVVGRKLPGNYSVELGYQNAWENYLATTYEDWTSVTNTLNPTLLYELTGKTKLLAQYSFGYRDFYQQPPAFSSNYTVQQAMAGFRWAATARLSGELKGGYAFRQFLNEFNELGVPYLNNNVPVYAANLRYLISSKSTVELNLNRQFLMGTISSRDIAIVGNSYTRDTFGLSFTTNVSKRLAFNLAGNYYLDQYDDTGLFAGLTEHWYYATLNFRHQLRRHIWWGLGYQYQNRDSPIPVNNYKVNAVTASILLTY